MKKPLKTVSDIDFLMKEWDFVKNSEEGIDPYKLGAQSNKYAYWICEKGHKWRAKISNRYIIYLF